MVAPVDPISLTIGAVALASLFSLCVQYFDLIDVASNLGLDYEILLVKLSIEKRRLMIWGEAVGILRPDEDRDLLLDDAETHALVERILMNIQKLFHDADALRSKYGLEKASQKPVIRAATVEGSMICNSQFENSSFVQFQKRVSGYHQKAGLMSKTRWAIRDNGKFIRLITNLKDLLDGLDQITTSARTSILKGCLVRQETESIQDLRTLKIIEDTCLDADWKSCASAASEYLNTPGSMHPAKRKYIHEWIEIDQNQKASPPMQVITRPESWTHPHDSRSQERDASPASSPDGQEQFNSMNESKNQRSLVLQSISKRCPLFSLEMRSSLNVDRPNDGPAYTEVLVMCSTTTLVAWNPSIKKHSYPIHSIPQTTKANHMTYSQVMRAIKPHTDPRTCIAIYCPPRMRYIHMALLFLGLEAQTSFGYRCQIRIDDRLLDKTTSFVDIPERMGGYYRELVEAADSEDPKVRSLLDAIDLNWLEQRIDCLTLPSYRPLSQTLDWYTIFRQSKDDPYCVGIIVMAGQETCKTLFRTAPVTPPDNFRGEGRVYRLRELEGVNDKSKFRWKAEHYCNMSVDKDFDDLP
jgi:Prion-inhibition and propagation